MMWPCLAGNKWLPNIRNGMTADQYSLYILSTIGNKGLS